MTAQAAKCHQVIWVFQQEALKQERRLNPGTIEFTDIHPESELTGIYLENL